VSTNAQWAFLKRAWLAGLVSLLVAGPTLAQTTTSTLEGHVLDPSGVEGAAPPNLERYSTQISGEAPS